MKKKPLRRHYRAISILCLTLTFATGFFTFSPAALAQSPPPVELTFPGEGTNVSDDLRAHFSVLSAWGSPPLDPSLYPQVTSNLAGVEALVRKLDSLAEAQGRLNIVITDTAAVDASYKKLSGGERVITLSTGLLRFVQNDHELAFVIGHELEHPHSQLEQNTDAKWVKNLIKRSVESEVDLRSIFHRMIAGGFNPYAAEDFLGRLQRLYGDHLQQDYVANSTRRDAISNLIVGLRRGSGSLIQQLSSYSDDAVRGVRSYLRSATYKQKQAERVEKVIASAPGNTDQFFVDTILGKHERDGLPNRSIYEPLQKEVLRLSRELLPESRIHDFLVQVHARIDQELESSRRRIFTLHPGSLEPEQLLRLRALLRRDYSTNLPDLSLTLTRIFDRQTDLSKVKGELRAAVTGSESHASLVSRKRKLELELAMERERFVRSKLAYQRINPEVFERFAEDYRKNGHPARLHFEQELNSRRKIVGESVLLREKEFSRVVRQNEEVLAQAMALGNRQAEFLLSEWMPLEADRIRFRAFDQFMQLLEKAGGEPYRSGYLAIPSEAFKGAFRAAPAQAAQIYSDYLAQALKSSMDPKDKSTMLQELVLSKNAIPALIQQALLKKHLKDYLDLGGVVYAGQTKTSEPESAAKALLSYQRSVERALSDAGLPTEQAKISENVLQAASEEYRKGSRSPSQLNATHQLFLQKPELLKRVEPSLRPSIQELWSSYRALPPGDGVGVDRLWPRVSFTSVIELFEGDVSEGELFQEVLRHREIMVFDGLSGADAPGASAHLQATRRFFQYLRSKTPADFATAGRVLSKSASIAEMGQPDAVSDLREQLLQEHITTLKRSFAEKPFREVTSTISQTLEATYGNSWNPFELVRALNSTSSHWLPNSVAARVEMALALLKPFRFTNQYPYASLLPARVLPDQASLRQVPLSLLIEYWLTVSRDTRLGPEYDELFHYIWAETEGKPLLREQLKSPELVKRLFFEDEKIKLARWQVEELLKANPIPATTAGIRPVVTEALEHVNRQFHEPGGTKNQIIAVIENNLLTNEEETAFLLKYRQSVRDPKPSAQLAFVDAVQHASSAASSNYQKMHFIEYVLGRTDEPPSPMSAEQGAVLRRIYSNTGQHARAFALQPLLSEDTGILSEPEMTERLFHLILGKNVREPVIRELFFSYLESLTKSEKRIVISQELASISGKAQGGASARTVLELMGPLGVKAGQFLRTSGLVGRDLRLELDGFLDRALPPDRPQVWERLREVFGERLRHVEHLGGLVGSGSVNYVVRADLQDPETGVRKSVVIRLLRQETQGQIQNENSIWERAITKLRNSNDRSAAHWGDILEEARAHSMHTLSPGGPEFDLELERLNHPRAQVAYGSPADAVSGFRTVAVQPEPGLQKLVEGSQAKSVSILEYVEHTPLKTLEPGLRQRLAEQIVERELHAIFEGGVYDPDGHPGNWLVDVKGKRLVRIDYAQLRELAPGKREAMQKIFALLVQPNFSTADGARLADLCGEIYQLPEDLMDFRHALTGILRARELPSHRSPQERLLFLRQELENHFAREGRALKLRFTPDMRSIISALARNRAFQELMPDPKGYERALLKAIQLSPAQLARKTIGNGARNVAESLGAPALAEKWQGCAAGFGRVLKRLR